MSKEIQVLFLDDEENVLKSITRLFLEERYGVAVAINAKEAMEINVFTVLCDVGSSADSAVKEFSDRIETASTFSAEEAESKLFRHL